jgi:hypothetical protein
VEQLTEELNLYQIALLIYNGDISFFDERLSSLDNIDQKALQFILDAMYFRDRCPVKNKVIE